MSIWMDFDVFGTEKCFFWELEASRKRTEVPTERSWRCFGDVDWSGLVEFAKFLERETFGF